MLIASPVLIVVAIVLLGYGLVAGSNAGFVASIAASLLAAVVLIAGARRGAAVRAARRQDEREREQERERAWALASLSAAAPTEVNAAARGETEDQRRPATAGAPGRVEAPDTTGAPRTQTERRDEAASDQTAVLTAVRDERGIPSQSAVGDVDRGYRDDDDADDPPNEPPAQLTSAGEAARVAGMRAEVLVVDGRPRYHGSGCVHLLGRQSEPLPVCEAVELGFTPCSLCEPDSALLAEARRV